MTRCPVSMTRLGPFRSFVPVCLGLIALVGCDDRRSEDGHVATRRVGVALLVGHLEAVMTSFRVDILPLMPPPRQEAGTEQPSIDVGPAPAMVMGGVLLALVAVALLAWLLRARSK